MNHVQDIESQVKAILFNLFSNSNPDDITNQTDLYDIGLDSLNAIQLIVQLEDAFGISIDDDELLYENFNTIPKIVDIVKSKLVIENNAI
ncbi:acyl carrier protein [Paenibacillus sp. FSL W8-0186]|uniref:acyl carrier protein n=1 Tax=Paenibacillus TaxID=44249 RepID=UPI0030D34FC4